jgi:formate C-acetyltransferase
MSYTAKLLNENRLIKAVQITDAQRPTVSMPVKIKLNPNVKICLERAELVTESYKRTEAEPWIVRRAKALDNLLRNMTIYILEGEQIVGNYASTPDSLPTYPEISCRWLDEELDDAFVHTLDEEGKRRLREIHQYWYDVNVEGTILRNLPEDLRDFISSSKTTAMMTIFWPLGCFTLDLKDWVFPRGLNGILEEVSERRAGLLKDDADFQEKKDFYDAAEISAKAMIAFARRYSALASEKAASASGKAREDYLKVAEVCSRVPEHPPQTFHEALQAFFFCHLVTAQIDWYSVGIGQRFDQLFWPCYVRQKEEGSITYDRAVELLEFLWIKLDDLGQINPVTTSIYQAGGTKFQNISVGGVDGNGEDASNELSLAILDATINIRTPQPGVCVLYHDRMDPKLIDKTIDCIASGMGQPAIFNNDVCIKWHLNLALDILYPDSGRFIGVPYLGLVQKADSLVRKVIAHLPASLREKLERRYDGWPYSVYTGGGKLGDSLRVALKKMHLWDAQKGLALARGWAPTSCVGGGLQGKVTIQGTLTSILIFTVLDFLKCFEYVMYQGVEPETGKLVALPTPDPRSFHTYDEFLDAYLKQVEFQVDRANRAYQVAEMIYEEHMPRPFASVCSETCVARGRDGMRRGDASISEIFSMGSVNAAESMAAVKKLVFDDGAVTMEELLKACDANWEGYEHIHRMCLEVPKFGNDDDYVDHILDDLYRKVQALVYSHKDHWGNGLHLESSLAAGYYVGGLTCSATPDGRVKGETVSDGQLSPMHGRDINGPTAVLKSCSKVDPLKSWNQLCNQKINPAFLKGDKKKLFADYLRTWLGFNNWHIQFNCMDAATLRDAMLQPEQHRNLIVRVAGYSAFFIDLAPGLQVDILRRTEQNLGEIRAQG